MKILSAIFLVCVNVLLHAQFTNVSSQYNFELAGTSTQSGCGVSFYDYDKDGWDDLTIGQASNEILVYHNDNGDYNIAFTFPNTGDPKQLCWVDIDNDGDADFFYCIKNNGCRLFRNDGLNQFTEITSNLNLPVTFGNSFGAAWGDYDKDGFLDVYVCNYSSGMPQHTNWLLHNNGDATFTDVTTAMGVGNGFKPSYQCTWVDINLDGWLDIYVVNDFSYINELFINNGITFDAAGAEYGLDIEMEGMSIAWSDFDHDTDLDVFISDNLPGNKLMRNDGGVMTDIAATAGVEVNSTCWGSLWLDYDHDGLDDLHISTSNLTVNSNQNYLFHNNGNYTFTDASMVGDNQIVFASAKGDKNNDGYWDFIEMKQYPAAVALYQNNGGSNHWIKTGLTGTVSNRDGIGAIIRYYYNGNEYMCHTFCGEGFLDQDSQYEILSLGSNTSVDSLNVLWPSGWTDRYYNLAADQFYSFIEGETYVVEVENISGHLLCPEGNSVELMASEGVSYQWSNDSTQQIIPATTPGVYSVIVTNEFGIQAEAFYEVTQYTLPDITADILQPSCFGGNNGCITLSATNGELNSIFWDGIQGDLMHCSLDSGIYVTEIIDENTCTQTHSWIVDEPLELLAAFTADTACYNATVIAQIVITGGTGLYNQNWNSSDPLALTPGEHTLLVTDENLCEVTASYVVEEFPEITFEYVSDTICENETLNLFYQIGGIDEGFLIDWFGANPEMLSGGDSPFLITNTNDCTLTGSVHVDISTAMDLTITVVNAQNGNNGSASVSVTGGIEPYSFLWSDESTDDQLQNIGQGVYPVTVTDAAGCQATDQAEIIDIRVDEKTIDIFLAPNPCNDFLTIRLGQPQEIRLYDASGKLISDFLVTDSTHTLDTSDLPIGLYMLRVGNSHVGFMKQ